jgi:hypothetical protein
LKREGQGQKKGVEVSRDPDTVFDMFVKEKDTPSSKETLRGNFKFPHILYRNRITDHGTIVSVINCFVDVMDRFAPLQLHVVQEMKQTDKGKTKRNDKEK